MEENTKKTQKQTENVIGKENKIVTGVIWQQLLLFFFPILFGTFFQQLYNAADAVIELPTVSRIHAKIRKREGEYYLTDLNSRNGTSVNGKILKGDEEYCLQDQDQIDFAQARYVFLK